MVRQVLQAVKRTETGKNENNRLRAKGRVPINIISGGKSIPASVDDAEVTKLVNSGIRSATLVDLELEGEKSLVFVKEIQRFPESQKIRHIDFYRVSPGKKILAKVGIITTGTAKGSKAGGQFEHILHEMTIKSTPEEIRDVVVVDVTNLDVGQSIKVSQLDTPKGWDIIVNGDPIVTSVNVTKALLAAERTEKQAAAPAKGAAKAPAKAPAAAAKPAAAAPAAKKK